MFHRNGQRPDKAITHPDTQKSTNKGRGHTEADALWPLRKEVHGNDDAQNRGDDTKTGQSIRDFVDRVGWLLHFVMSAVDLVFHHAFQFMGCHVAGADDPQIIRDESEEVLRFHDGRIPTENLAGFRVVDVFFNGHHALLPRFVENLVQETQKIHIKRSVIGRSRQLSNDAFANLFYGVEGIGDDEGSNRGAANDKNFGRLP